MFKSNPPYAGYFSNAEFPVIEAIHNKDKETLKTMMKQGWNVNSTGKYGMSYLLYAVWEKNYPMTEFLLENGADPNFLSNIWDETPNDGEAYLPLSTVCNGKYNTKFIKLLIDMVPMSMMTVQSCLFVKQHQAMTSRRLSIFWNTGQISISSITIRKL